MKAAVAKPRQIVRISQNVFTYILQTNPYLNARAIVSTLYLNMPI